MYVYIDEGGRMKSSWLAIMIEVRVLLGRKKVTLHKAIKEVTW